MFLEESCDRAENHGGAVIPVIRGGMRMVATGKQKKFSRGPVLSGPLLKYSGYISCCAESWVYSAVWPHCSARPSLTASSPPTTGIVMDVPSRSIVSSVPGFGQSVKSRSLEKIMSAICCPAGMT